MLRTAFRVAALGFGGFGTVLGGLGLATGGWSSGAESGGVDLTNLGVVFTLASAGIFALGYRSLKSSGQSNNSPTSSENRNTTNKPDV